MPRINLLPWREELRQKRKKDFLTAALGAVIVGAALTFGAKLFYQSRISSQETRNEMLRTEIADLDRQIAEIDNLDAQKTRLLNRMEIIDRLERSRPEAVHLMDEAVDLLPDGTHLTALSQTQNRIQLTGVAQSSTRISVLMRNVNDSEYLREPLLDGIQFTGTGPDREGEFVVFANQIPLNEEDGEGF